jgi:hypothetical protein
MKRLKKVAKLFGSCFEGRSPSVIVFKLLALMLVEPVLDGHSSGKPSMFVYAIY